jgi:hypothetical protein
VILESAVERGVVMRWEVFVDRVGSGGEQLEGLVEFSFRTTVKIKRFC